MKKIKLTQGQYAIVDNNDFDYLNQYKWHAAFDKRSGKYYCIRSQYNKITKKDDTIRMHRLIMNCPKGLQIDHINHNRLDNRKNNLRIVNNSQNQMNRKINKNKTSKYKGVYLFCKNKWRVIAAFNKKKYHLGLFDNEIDAAKKYNEFAIKYFKEYAYLNEV